MDGLRLSLDLALNTYLGRDEDEPFTYEEIAAGLRAVLSVQHSECRFGQPLYYGFYDADLLGAVSGIVFSEIKSSLTDHPRLPPTEIGQAILNKCRANREALRKAEK